MVLGNTFKGGFHAHGYKELTNNGKLVEVPAPDVVKIPMAQHIGSPATPLVKKGDQVKVGQLIGEASGFISANVHSSVSGTVQKVEESNTERGRNIKTIFIENDGQDSLGYEVLDRKLEDLDKDEIVHIVKEAGITGLGGASFPTHVKLTPPEDKKIDSVIINAAECEPYLTADDTLLRLHSDKVILGLKACMKAVGAKDGYITIEDNKPEAIEALNKALEGEDIKLVVAKTKYPQGDEKRIIDVTLDRQVPIGGLPADVGTLVSNAATAYAIYKAVYKGIPLYERIMTFTGSSMKSPVNGLVRFGTPIIDAVNAVGGFKEDLGKLIVGGPMMGLAQFDWEVPLEKANNGILAMSKKEAQMRQPEPCIRCAKCVEVCPMGLLPFKLAKLVDHDRAEDAQENDIMSCIECGSCSYICPAARPLVETIRVGKNQVRSLAK